MKISNSKANSGRIHLKTSKKGLNRLRKLFKSKTPYKLTERRGRMRFQEEEWDVVKDQNFELITLTNDRIKILEKVGYSVDHEGFIIDAKTKKKIKAEMDNKPINVRKDKKFALIAGSHIFVRNVVDYSRYLAEKGKLPEIEAKSGNRD